MQRKRKIDDVTGPDPRGRAQASAGRRRIDPGAVRVLVSLLIGVAAGVAVRALPPDQRARAIGLIEPLGTLWINAIRMTVMPLVVSTLLAGIGGAAHAGSVARLGARGLAVFIAMVASAGLFAALTVPGLVSRLPIDRAAVEAFHAEAAAGAPRSAERLPTAGQWVTSLVPKNALAAAAEDALLPLLVFVLAFGFALARVPESTRVPVVTFFEGVAAAMLVLVTWVLALAPIGVFALAVPLAARAGLSTAGALGGYVVLVCVLVAGFALLLYPAAVVLGRVPLRRFVRACLPAQAVAIAARSSLAALPAMLEAAETQLGIRPTTSGFLLPLAVGLQKVALPISITTGVLFLARIEGSDLDAQLVGTTVFASVLLSFAVPGIPSGSVLMLVPVLAAVGVPASGVGLLLAVDLLPDVVKTTAHVTADLAATAIAERFAGDSK